MSGSEPPLSERIPKPRPAGSFQSAYFAPSGFVWAIDGRLAGMPRPGLSQSIDADAAALQRVGIGALVSLTDEWEVPSDPFESRGIAVLRLPLADMGIPTFDEADDLCGRVASLLADDQSVVFHCRAGRGRTGTMLAAQMLWYVPDVATALAYLKWRNRTWIESEQQLAFVAAYGRYREENTDQHAG